jgi:peptide/nickel transport system permease protein/peptide/nickel transport system substrate-binding protein
VSYGYGLTVSDVKALQKAGVTVNVSPTIAFAMIYFNMSQAPVNNKLVREAVNYAIDRQALVQAIQQGYGQVEWFPTPNNDPLYASSLAPSFPYNPAKAKQLLAQAGYPHGVTITSNTVTGQDQLVALLESELGAVGINFKVTALSVSPMITTYFVQKNYNTELSGWSGRPSQNQTYDTLFGEPSFQNTGNVTIPGFSAGLAALNGAATPAAQKQAMANLDSLVDGYAPYVPLYFEVNVTAYQPYVQGSYPDTLGKNLAIKDLTLGS